jgi:hypothetical protein
VPPRTRTAKALVGALVLATAVLTVGLTASADSAFTIAIRPVFLRLGIDIDIRIGTIHLHASWSALDSGLLTTKSDGGQF